MENSYFLGAKEEKAKWNIIDKFISNNLDSLIDYFGVDKNHFKEVVCFIFDLKFDSVYEFEELSFNDFILKHKEYLHDVDNGFYD